MPYYPDVSSGGGSTVTFSGAGIAKGIEDKRKNEEDKLKNERVYGFLQDLYNKNWDTSTAKKKALLMGVLDDPGVKQAIFDKARTENVDKVGGAIKSLETENIPQIGMGGPVTTAGGVDIPGGTPEALGTVNRPTGQTATQEQIMQHPDVQNIPMGEMSTMPGFKGRPEEPKQMTENQRENVDYKKGLSEARKNNEERLWYQATTGRINTLIRQKATKARIRDAAIDAEAEMGAEMKTIEDEIREVKNLKANVASGDNPFAAMENEGRDFDAEIRDKQVQLEKIKALKATMKTYSNIGVNEIENIPGIPGAANNKPNIGLFQ